MQNKTTVSLHCGTKLSVAHNYRTSDNGLDHIDSSMSALNTKRVNINRFDLIKDIFGEAYLSFNQKQSRSDRKIDITIGDAVSGEKIYQHLRKKNSKFRELIIAVGKYDDDVPSSTKRKILDEYSSGFQKRNPNLVVFSDITHNDEAQPHTHIDFIPIAHNSGKGISMTMAFDKALAEQFGQEYIPTKSKWNNLYWTTFRKQEMEALSKIMQKYNLSIEPGDNRKMHLSKKEYAKMMSQERSLVSEIELLKSRQDNLKNELSGIKSQIDIYKAITDFIKSQDFDLFQLISDASKKYLSFRKEGFSVYEAIIETYYDLKDEFATLFDTSNRDFER